LRPAAAPVALLRPARLHGRAGAVEDEVAVARQLADLQRDIRQRHQQRPGYALRPQAGGGQ
jgi:hypothetical protein